MPDDHSKLVPPLPIPNRTVKRLCADDSASTRVKVGHRQASYSAKSAKSNKQKGPSIRGALLRWNVGLHDGAFAFCINGKATTCTSAKNRVYSCLGNQIRECKVAISSSPFPYIVEDSVGYLISRVKAQIAKSLDDALVPQGITHAQGGILLMLASGRFDNSSQLARELYIDAAAMTRMLDRLEKRQLIVRMPSDADRRIMTLQLTEDGRALAAELPEIYVAAREKNFAGLSAEEMGFLKSLLRRILRNVDVVDSAMRGQTSTIGTNNAK